MRAPRRDGVTTFRAILLKFLNHVTNHPATVVDTLQSRTDRNGPSNIPLDMVTLGLRYGVFEWTNLFDRHDSNSMM
ncbi:hypothetical protein INR49_000357 [Caranx melampygus]|nr:hypothetical protein INR49_000357 [Caranx melampygus]